MDLTDFHDAWMWLLEHPAFSSKRNVEGEEPHKPFGRFLEALDIDVAKVDPLTRRVEDDRARNTATAVWLECGQCVDAHDLGYSAQLGGSAAFGVLVHDINLNCGGPTFEQAIVKLAARVLKHYGDYPPSAAVSPPGVTKVLWYDRPAPQDPHPS